MKRLLAPLLCAALCACAGVKKNFAPADALSADDHFRLGAAFESNGLSNDALKHYQRAAKRNPSNAEVWVALGNLKFKNGDFAGAEEDYERALNRSPYHAGAQNNLALAYLAQNKKLKEAELLAKSALRQNGALRPYVLDTLANIYAREGRLPEARVAAEQAAAAAASKGITLPSKPESL
jgi:tetratricopeptide (TPR) repeat protein